MSRSDRKVGLSNAGAENQNCFLFTSQLTFNRGSPSRENHRPMKLSSHNGRNNEAIARAAGNIAKGQQILDKEHTGQQHVDVNWRNGEGWTQLLVAILFHKNIQVVKVRSGHPNVDINLVSRSNLTPLIWQSYYMVRLKSSSFCCCCDLIFKWIFPALIVDGHH